ncbi:MAG: HutD family protein [Polaromonas sp.]
MSWNVVQLVDVQATPWRNGGGITRELAAWPGADDWVWRMSVAEVEKSGAFSSFDGVERWFAVLQGAGVVLNVDGMHHRVGTSDTPLFFDGAAATDCQLIDGPTQDFNLMVRKGPVPSRMHRVNESFSATVDAPETIAIYAHVSGATVLFESEILQLPAGNLAWRTVTGRAAVRITAPWALWMEIPA